MNDTADTTEQTAQKFAGLGRDSLLTRLRPAFAEAAAKHADVLTLDDEQLEQMVQRAADNADGLQWRRALAAVAAKELGIGLGEALGHPAVARAQAIVGAPSYEDSLAELASGRRPSTQQTAGTRGQASGTAEEPDAVESAAAEPVAETDPEPVAETDPEPVAEPDPEPVAETDHDEPDDELQAEQLLDGELTTEALEDGELQEAPAEPGSVAGESRSRGVLRLSAVHIGGIANLAAGEGDLQLRLTGAGLDIVRSAHDSLGRLTWPEVKGLDVSAGRGRRRRRRGAATQLVIRTRHGDASFEIPELEPDELRKQLSPWSARTTVR